MNTSSDFFQLLNLRSEYEEIARNLEMPADRREGIINNLEWFLNHGNKKNRFREGYDRAVEICKEILNYKL